MVVRVLRSPEQVALAAADVVASVLDGRSGVRLGVATGATPLPLYRELVRLHAQGRLPVDGLELFLLDEYLGLAPGDARSFAAVIRAALARPLDLPEGAVHAPDVDADDLDAACRRFDAARDDRGIDLQILGIGTNGHIAFNEPGSDLDSACRVVPLSEQTRADNGLGAGDPTRAITVGIASILRAHRLLLVATGTAKATALARAVAGDPAVPATAILDHPDLTILADRAAAAALRAHADRTRSRAPGNEAGAA